MPGAVSYGFMYNLGYMDAIEDLILLTDEAKRMPDPNDSPWKFGADTGWNAALEMIREKMNRR